MFFQGLLLAIVWLAISGKFEPDYLFWGAVSIALVLWLNHGLRNVPLSEHEPGGSSQIIIHRLILYLIWLLWQMIKAGVYVAYVILHPRLPIEPVIVHFTSRQPNVIAKAILGNSITLTPGTLTMTISGDRFTVHALTRDIGQEPFSGEMGARVSRLYSRADDAEGRCCDVELSKSGRET